jgi:cellulose synthase/poly-beta-1,6-N-acetylglucosamine synthase-like glycosyltransferase
MKKNQKEVPQEDSRDFDFEPHVSIVIPTHNEEIIVSKKIENLLSLEYPKDKVEIIFVDDSTDSTAKIIEEYSRRCLNIRLIRFDERKGYSPCMIAGCNAAGGKIVVLNDAASFLDVHALANLVRHFRNPRIGVVTGNDLILNVDENIGESEHLYQRIFNFLRSAETKMDSTFYIKGEATAVRKGLIEDLQVCGETFDTTVGLFVRKKGYRIVYDPNVMFYEYAPSSHSGRIKQKTVRAANLIKVLWRFRNMMFKRQYGKYGCLILPMNFGMLVIAPLAILIWPLLLVPLGFVDTIFFLEILGAVGGVFLLLLLLSKRLLFTFLEFEYSLLKALFQVIFMRKTYDKIEKVESTRRFE